MELKALRLRLEELVPLFNKLRKVTGQPSLSVGVLHKGQIILQHAQGYASVNENRPVDKETGFLIASLTKAFTAASIGILVDQGKVSWNTPIKSIVPFEYQPDPVVTDRATIADFLSHRTGIDQLSLSWYGAYGVVLTRAKDLLHVLANFPIASEFRSAYNYCNHTYGVLGAAISKLSGSQTLSGWGCFVASHIFKPLGMCRTVSNFEDFPDANFAEPHMATIPNVPVQVARPPMTDETSTGASGSICSTIPDMLRWAEAILENIKAQSEGYSHASGSPLRNVLELVAHHVPVESKQLGEHSYGYGWARVSIPSPALGSMQINGPSEGRVIGRDSHPRLALYHGGQCTGYLSSFCLIPESDLAVIAVCNGEGFGDASDWAMQAVLQAALDLNPRVDILRAAQEHAHKSRRRFDKLMEAYEANRTKGTPKPSEKDLIGDYVNEALRLSFEVRLRAEGKLTMRVNGLESQQHDLQHFEHDSFGFPPTSMDDMMTRNLVDFVVWEQVVLRFKRGFYGSFQSLTWRISPDFPPFVFVKA